MIGNSKIYIYVIFIVQDQVLKHLIQQNLQLALFIIIEIFKK